MFAFNRTSFNRPTLAEIFASMEMNGISGVDLSAAYTTTTQATFDGESGIGLPFGRITFSSMLADGVGEITLPFGKVRTFSTNWQGIGTFEVNNESFSIFIMEYFGDLAPNDRVIINTERFTVTKNNQNALEEFDGNFIDLKEGINEVVFEDGETSRTVLIRIEHTDRFL